MHSKFVSLVVPIFCIFLSNQVLAVSFNSKNENRKEFSFPIPELTSVEKADDDGLPHYAMSPKNLKILAKFEESLYDFFKRIYSLYHSGNTEDSSFKKIAL